MFLRHYLHVGVIIRVDTIVLVLDVTLVWVDNCPFSLGVYYVVTVLRLEHVRLGPYYPRPII